ncbi:hypothetical protein [Pseudoruegeria sp. HB172150]|uniref:hypothetical protein n=1 Tax=Pseudoruegeria sp. HB172150 TaxID=2721164 RepID=UPI001558007C|nr:hypothetical protein [Pseudoruegeria sp. HB172150]
MTRMNLPEDFNPATAMRQSATEEGVFHETRKAAGLAARLLASDDPDDLALAATVLEAVLECQELRDGNPHRGNFKWMREDAFVADLNAGVFVLTALLPALLQYPDRLPRSLDALLRERVRLAIDEVERLDVDIRYSNIALLDCYARSAGGAWLGDAALSERGAAKLARWAEKTGAGHPAEFNSPTYTAIDLRALAALAELAPDAPTRWLAQAMRDRLALSVMLHLDQTTGRWAGPHGRAYSEALKRDGSERGRLREMVDERRLPHWALEVQAGGEITETTDRDARQRMVSFHGEGFSLGSATSAPHPQANSVFATYSLGSGGGAMFTRYLHNDRWFGDTRHATDRTRHRHLPDEGRTFAVQDHERVLMLSSPKGALWDCTAAGLSVAWVCEPEEVKVWAGGDWLALPATLPDDGAPVVVEIGGVRFGLRVAERTNLGEGRVTVSHRDGCLVFEVANYRGPQKDFWETVPAGFFFQGPPIACLYLEVRPETAHGDAAVFADQLAEGVLRAGDGRDIGALRTAEPVTTVRHRGIRTVSYTRDGRSFALTTDLGEWAFEEGYLHEMPWDWPGLRADRALANESGMLELGGFRYRGPDAPAWGYCREDLEFCACGYLGREPATLTMVLPDGKALTFATEGPGTLVWRNGEIETFGAFPELGD